MTKIGAAYLAASFLTSRHVDAVAGEYLSWIDGHGDEDTAIDALLAAARFSKSPARVMLKADAYYSDFADGVPGDGANDAPSIISLDPDEGPLAGGTVVTIEGAGFTGVTGVTFDGNAGTDLTIVSDTELTVKTPAGGAGAKDVVITNPWGSDTKTGGFTYVAAGG